MERGALTANGSTQLYYLNNVKCCELATFARGDLSTRRLQRHIDTKQELQLLRDNDQRETNGSYQVN